MNYLEAFYVQFLLFMIGFAHQCLCYLFIPGRKLNPFPNIAVLILVLVLWFGLGTWFRHYLQMGILGMWGRFA